MAKGIIALTVAAAALFGASTLAFAGTCEAGMKAGCDASKTTQVVRTESKDTHAAVGDIVAVAAGNENFKTLVAAVKAAGLVETLQGPGPFTVFAPTDAAFAKLPAGTVENLLKPENKEKLQAVLKYHVVSGNVKAADVVKLDKATTVNGKDVKIAVKDGKVSVNDANVTQTDIAAKNGTIHVIDTVLLP